ncbi:MAG: hypothetical protein EBV19_06615 [Flavobacteriia bacterium]|nr:hypothetical protein [Flavobacteriia bacterium]
MSAGTASSYDSTIPDEAKNDIGDIFAAGNYCFVIKKNGKVVAWDSVMGQKFLIPQELESGVVLVSATGSYLLALKESGEVFAYNIFSSPTAGMPGGPTTQLVLSPLEVPLEAKQNAVRVHANGLYVLKENGEVVSWNISNPSVRRELPNELNSGVSYISDGLALKTNGEVVSWSTGVSAHPVPIELKTDIIKVSGSWNYPIALNKNGVVYRWDGSGNILTNPAETSIGIVDIFSPSMGNGPYYALNTNGRLLKWYDNSSSVSSLPVELSQAIPFIAGGDSGFGLSRSPDVAVQTYVGLPLDILAELVAEKIRNKPFNYGLSTQSNTVSSINDAVINLATKSELTYALTQSRADGINSVISNPNLWTLYTTNQIKNMAIGDLVLTRTNNGQFILNYDIEQSEDLANWTPYAGFAMPLTNLPTDKAFVRIKAKQ